MTCYTLRQFAIAALLLPVSLAGCTAPNAPTAPQAAASQSPDRQLKVVTTFLPMYLFTKAVVGDTATVAILIKPGTEVHEYQSTPTDVQAIAQADVVVKNGLQLETFLDSTIKSAGNARLKVIDASQGLQALKQSSPVYAAVGDDRPPDTSAGNPHVWLSPVLAQKQVETIRDGLIAADPAHQTAYKANAAAYIQKLSDLSNQFEQRLKGYKDRTFITFHDAFPYLAQQYQLQQVAVVQIPEDQLAPADVQKTVETVKRFKVKALFSEPGIDNKLLTTLSNDLKLTVYPLNSLESGQLDPQYYFTAMQANLQNLETAFK